MNTGLTANGPGDDQFTGADVAGDRAGADAYCPCKFFAGETLLTYDLGSELVLIPSGSVASGPGGFFWSRRFHATTTFRAIGGGTSPLRMRCQTRATSPES